MFRLSLNLILIFLASSAWARPSVDIPAGSSRNSLLRKLEARGCALSGPSLVLPLAHADLRQKVNPESNEETCQAEEWLLLERDLLLRPLLQNEVSATLQVFDEYPIFLSGLEASLAGAWANREGRILDRGAALYLEAIGNAEMGRDWGLAFSANPGWVGIYSDFQTGLGRFYLQEGYVRIGYKRLDLTAGRIAQRFGEGEHGNLLFGGASRPMGMIRLTLRPTLEGFLSAFKWDLWVSEKNESAFLDQSRYLGMSVAFQPVEGWDVALAELHQFSGVGQPELEPSDFLKMLSVGAPGGLWQRSVGAALGGWLFKKRLRLFGQALFTDRSSQNLVTSYSWGFWLPQISGGDLSVEFAKTAPGSYQHNVWRQGLAFKGSPIGTPLGPDGQGIYVDFTFAGISKWRPTAKFALEKRGLSLSGANMPETRYGFGGNVTRRWLNTELSLAVNYQQIENARFLPQETGSSFAFLGTIAYAFY